MKRNFIFDLDGTLVDSLPGIVASLNAALPQSAKPVDDLRPYIGPPIRSILYTLAQPVSESALDRMEKRFRSSYDAEGWRGTVEYTGAGEVLEQLRLAGKRIFLVTNKPAVPTASILGSLSMSRCFDDVLTPDSRKPAFRNKAEMLGFLMEKHRLEAADSIMVGDTADDCAAAESVGMAVIMVAHGYGNGQPPAGLSPCPVVPDLSAILKWSRKYGAET